jgi:preprotein translocase subunit YajC
VQNGSQLLLLLVLAVFTVWVFSRGRRQQRDARLTQSRLQAGAEVMLTSGLYATVLEVTDDGLVHLETSPGVVSRWDRRAVARIVSAPGPGPALEDEPAAPDAFESGEVQPEDAVEGDVMQRSEPVVPVEPRPPTSAPPGPRPAAGEAPGSRSGAAEPSGPVSSPEDVTPPDRD